MLTLTPQTFLAHLAGGIGSCEFLNPIDRLIIRHHADVSSGARTFRELDPAVRDYSFFLAREFVRRIPGSVTARVFGPEGIERPITPDIQGGVPLTRDLSPQDEFVIDVRCGSSAFDRIGNGLPTASNWEISLRDLEQGFDGAGHLVVFGGINGAGRWCPDEDRPMAFRMPSPGLVMQKIRSVRPESAINPVYVGGLVTFRVYEQLLAVNQWPVGIPADWQRVDEEGPRHPLYFTYHDLGHAAIRSRRPTSLRNMGHRLLRAGLAVFPHVDGVSPQENPGRILSQFFGQLIELKSIYFPDQMALVLEKTTAAYLDCVFQAPQVRRYAQFLDEAEGCLRVLSVDSDKSRFEPLWEGIRRSQRAVEKRLEF